MTKNTKGYVDGFVFIVPKNKVATSKKMASEAKEMWVRHGALDYKECKLEDKRPKHVKLVFSDLTKAGTDDTVWFSFITYKSKKHRNEVNKKVMKNPAMKQYEMSDMDKMPFDMNKMSFGGFEVIV
jgi:uncharacterized protein YbaA (DUF1428 family)